MSCSVSCWRGGLRPRVQRRRVRSGGGADDERAAGGGGARTGGGGRDAGRSVPGEPGVRPLLARGRGPGRHARGSANPEAPGSSQAPATRSPLFGPLCPRTMFSFLRGLLTSSGEMVSKAPRQCGFAKSPPGAAMTSGNPRRGRRLPRPPRTPHALRARGRGPVPAPLGPASGLTMTDLASQHAPRSSDRSVTTTSHRSRANCLRRTPLPHAGPEPQPRHPGRRQRASYSGGDGDSPGCGPRKQQHRGGPRTGAVSLGAPGSLDTDQRDAWSPRLKAADSPR